MPPAPHRGRVAVLRSVTGIVGFFGYLQRPYLQRPLSPVAATVASIRTPQVASCRAGGWWSGALLVCSNDRAELGAPAVVIHRKANPASGQKTAASFWC